MATEVPFIDLGGPIAGLKEAILADISALIDTGAFTNGPQVAQFEDAFATYCGGAHCVGLASGLDALRLALLAAGVGAGDEVIVPANTFVATVEAVVQTGATPVLADVTEADYNLDPAALETAITSRTRAVIPVHLYGQMADMASLEPVAARHGLTVVEDAAQAHGATRDGRRAGSTGLAGAFSFYPAKNLGAFGDAGACVTDDGEMAATMRALREHGQREKHAHDLVGYTARLDTLQAIALRHKLSHLNGWNDERRAAATHYADALDGVGDLQLPPVAERSEPVWHVYVVRTADPQRLADHLDRLGIATGRHYPRPVHMNEPYSQLGGPGDFPVSETLAAHGLSLPIFPGISEGQLTAVVEAIQRYFAAT
jgi:dTDP-4-amino-4,6-dideoxygalactose transaminase